MDASKGISVGFSTIKGIYSRLVTDAMRLICCGASKSVGI